MWIRSQHPHLQHPTGTLTDVLVVEDGERFIATVRDLFSYMYIIFGIRCAVQFKVRDTDIFQQAWEADTANLKLAHASKGKASPWIPHAVEDYRLS